MKEEYFERIRKLPEFVQDALGEASYKSDIKLSNDYGLSGEALSHLTDIEARILLKEISIEDVFEVIKKELELDDKIAKEISLIILCEVLYPIKDYFPGIEDAITTLGGEIPKIKPKKQTQDLVDEEKIIERQERTVREQMEAEAKKEKIVEADIKTLLKNYSASGDQEIGQNSIDVPSVALSVKPKIKYWIECYKEATGYGWNTNMERVKFIYHDKNTRGMNEEERRQLGMVLKSLDEGTSLAYLVKARRIDFMEEEN